MVVSYSAPAKVILSGEHSVVFGKPALVSSFNLRLRFTLNEEISGQSEKEKQDETVCFISQTVKDFLSKEKIKFKDKDYFYKIDSQIPIGRGMGSSAALSVATVACFLKFYTGKEFEKDKINNLAYKIEKHFHKNPSGVDNSASCYGGLVYFRKEFEFLKNISKLNFKIPKNIEEKLYLIDSGKPEESTLRMVSNVGKEYNQKPKKIEKIFIELEKLTKRMLLSIITKNEDLFMRTIKENEFFLEELGVVSDKTKELIKDLKNFGQGKITGAGGHKKGSGFILFWLKNNKRKEFNLFLDKYKFNYFSFKQDLKGLVV